MKWILNYIKKEAVLSISLLIALVSVAFVPLDDKYISYIDFHTLTILLRFQQLFCFPVLQKTYQN